MKQEIYENLCKKLLTDDVTRNMSEEAKVALRKSIEALVPCDVCNAGASKRESLPCSACIMNDMMSTATENCVVAMFTSHWSSGAEFTAPCMVNLTTREVFNIGNAGTAADDDDLEFGEVSFSSDALPDGSVFDTDEATSLGEDEDYFQSMINEHTFWRGDKSPAEVLADMKSDDEEGE